MNRLGGEAGDLMHVDQNVDLLAGMVQSNRTLGHGVSGDILVEVSILVLLGQDEVAHSQALALDLLPVLLPAKTQLFRGIRKESNGLQKGPFRLVSGGMAQGVRGTEGWRVARGRGLRHDEFVQVWVKYC